MRRAIVYINWEDYAEANDLESEDEEEIKKLKKNIKKVIKENYGFWELNDNEIIPSNYGDIVQVRPGRMADTLIPIIKFLNKNNIPWDGKKIAFMDEEDPGFLMISGDQIIIGNVDEDGDVEKEYISIGIKKKMT